MTPFGERVRDLRSKRSVTLKQMAADLGVSSAYFSALEHGHRGRPSSGLVMQICGYFDLMWDEAEELKRRPPPPPSGFNLVIQPGTVFYFRF